MADLVITNQTNGDAYICIVDGSIDSYNAEQLKGQAQAALQAKARRLLFDLTKVEYVASAGLGAFLEAMKSFPGKVVFVGLRPYVRRTFQLSGFDKLSPLCATLDEGLKA